jgi:hypothetical protein
LAAASTDQHRHQRQQVLDRAAEPSGLLLVFALQSGELGELPLASRA